MCPVELWPALHNVSIVTNFVVYNALVDMVTNFVVYNAQVDNAPFDIVAVLHNA